MADSCVKTSKFRQRHWCETLSPNYLSKGYIKLLFVYYYYICNVLSMTIDDRSVLGSYIKSVIALVVLLLF